MQFQVAKLLKNISKMRNWNNFCGIVTILLLFSLPIKAQQTDSVKIKEADTQVNYSPVFNKYSLPNLVLGNSSKKISTNIGNPFAHWGFMCVGEYKLEKKTGIPLRLRLGSLDYVNKL
ncbi:MAG TPA: hypothetical protein VK173_12475, partial [Lacibacter sp.]|nr:hypothetical protein [Lacibacter sp.]